MLGTKNLSPNQLSAFIALIIAFCMALAFAFLEGSCWLFFLSFAVIFLFCYLLVGQVLEKFIYHKIKLIYKFISNTKAGKQEEMYYKYLLPQKSMEEVRADVEKWALQRNAEIESLKTSENFRKEFMQNLSHEIKTPVFAIQGYLEILLEDDLDDIDNTRKLLHKISRNTDRLVHLLNDADEISRLETRSQKLVPENFVIQDLILEVYDSLSIQTIGKKINCSIKKGCESPTVVYADKEKIRQVIINLVINATKYGLQNGHIIASIYKMDDQRVLIEISDDGIGIAEDHLPRVFERFYRTDRSRSREVGGSGLGLAICKHIIEAHGEAIHIRSKIGVGTTVGFTLPVKK